MGDFKAPIGWYINQKRYMYVNCQQLNHTAQHRKKGEETGWAIARLWLLLLLLVMRPVNSNVIPYGVCSYMYIIAFFSKEEERKKG
jgi:hypothetical protein